MRICVWMLVLICAGVFGTKVFAQESSGELGSPTDPEDAGPVSEAVGEEESHHSDLQDQIDYLANPGPEDDANRPNDPESASDSSDPDLQEQIDFLADPDGVEHPEPELEGHDSDPGYEVDRPRPLDLGRQPETLEERGPSLPISAAQRPITLPRAVFSSGLELGMLFDLSRSKPFEFGAIGVPLRYGLTSYLEIFANPATLAFNDDSDVEFAGSELGLSLAGDIVSQLGIGAFVTLRTPSEFDVTRLFFGVRSRVRPIDFLMVDLSAAAQHVWAARSRDRGWFIHVDLALTASFAEFIFARASGGYFKTLSDEHEGYIRPSFSLGAVIAQRDVPLVEFEINLAPGTFDLRGRDDSPGMELGFRVTWFAHP